MLLKVSRLSLVWFWWIIYLPSVENHPGRVTDEEDNDNDDEHPGDTLVPPLSLGGSDIVQRGGSDDLEGEAVEEDEEDERDHGHHNKVGNEKIVTTISVVVSQVCCTNLKNKLISTFVSSSFMILFWKSLPYNIHFGN